MIRGKGKMTISEATVIEALQEWVRTNFAADHAPLITGITVNKNGNYGGPAEYELVLEEVKAAADAAG